MSSGLLMRVVHFFVGQWCRSALTLRVRGVVFHAIKQYLVFGLQPSRSIAYTHSTLKLTLCSSLQGCIPFRLRLFVFVNALHSVVKPHKFGFHNYAPFSTNKSLALRYCPHNTLDNTLSLYTSSLHERLATTLCSYSAHAKKIILLNIWFYLEQPTKIVYDPISSVNGENRYNTQYTIMMQKMKTKRFCI